MPLYNLSPAASALVPTARMPIKPPPTYTPEKVKSREPAVMPYSPSVCTKRLLMPAHCCIHMHTSIGT